LKEIEGWGTRVAWEEMSPGSSGELSDRVPMDQTKKVC